MAQLINPIKLQTNPLVNGIVYMTVRNSVGQAFRSDLPAFEDWEADHVPLYAIQMTDEFNSGFYVGNLPDTFLSGTVEVIAYLQAGSVPAVGDRVVGENEGQWNTGNLSVCSTGRTGGLLAELTCDAITTFVTDFAEPITYTPYRSTTNFEYLAVIDRETPTTIAGLTGAAAYRHEIYLINDPSGIKGPASIGRGTDTVAFPNRPIVGLPLTTFTVVEIIEQDQGVWHLGVGDSFAGR